MSIYIKHFPQADLVEHRTSCEQLLQLGALVRINPGYKFDFERYRAELAAGMTYRVVGLEVCPSSMRETMGIERERKANAEIAAGKERFYAGVRLRSVLRNEDGSLARIAQTPCEQFLSKMQSCILPADMLTLVEQGNGEQPRPDVDFSISPFEFLYPKYQAVDQSFEGYSNRPTASLGLFLMCDSPSRQLLERSRTKAGVLTEAKLRQLTHREGWLKHVDPEAYVTDPFPPLAPFRTEINYAEIAQTLTEACPA